ncbi:MAG: MAE_28990/MAE_18760 family HEPN-like nuclease [Sulfurimonas sp.]|jgi:hypothetical protein
MSDLRMFFEERKKEIDNYFMFLELFQIDTGTTKVLTIDDNRSMKINDNLQKNFKSQCILMLYNLVEGTVNKGIEFIFGKINDDALSYLNVNEKIKIIWYKHHVPKMKKIEIDNLEHPVEVIKFIENKYLTTIELNLDEFRQKNASYFSAGSLDSSVIRDDILKKRFDITMNQSEYVLREIKMKRNNLAHGEDSFVNCMNLTSFTEILAWKDKTFLFLDEYINTIENYVNNKSYKNSNLENI